MRFLALLCAFLMLVPTRAHAVDWQTGAGYVQGDCRQIGDSDRRACFTGERFDLGLNVVVKAKDDPDAGDTKVKHRSHGGGGGGGGWFHASSGDAALFILLVAVVILLVLGIIAFLSSLFSHRFSIGAYSSVTFQSAKLEGEAGLSVEKYHSQRTGFHTNIYFVPDFDFVVNFGVAAATSQIKTTSADEGDKSYNLRGTSSKFGLGYLPFQRAGIYGMVELENTHFDGFSLSKYARSNTKTKIPNNKSSGSFVLGLTF